MLLLIFVVVIFLCILHHVVYTTFYKHKSPKHARFWTEVPTVGVSPDGILPWVIGALHSITQCYEHSSLGYLTFNKQDDSVFSQSMMGVGPVVCLPISQLHVLNKPESELVTKKVQLEGLQPKYTTGDAAIFDHLIHFDVVRRFFRKNTLDKFIDPINEELNLAFRQHWGTRTSEWTTVEVWDSCTKIMTRVASRAIFGQELSCNDDFTEHARELGRAQFGGAAFINALPPVVRPLLGPLFGYSARKHEAACLKIILPLVEKRLQQLRDGLRGKEKPNDPIQWLIDECEKAGPRHLRPISMARGLLQLHLTSNFGVTYAFVGCILDLHSSVSCDEFVAGLREEHRIASKRYGKLSSSTIFEGLHRLDSAVRESMRLSTFPIISFMRVVSTQTDGLTLDNGTHLPAGTRIGIPGRAIHRDADFYPDPSEYDAFRFSRPFEEQQGEKREASTRITTATLTDSFLSFGYGRHACPGRWFASQYLKQALLQVITNYDVEISKPWKKTVMLNMILPPTEAEVRIRRRSEV
ncbi:cytochrome P450 [Xylaria arbuscula]|nr:cytochrome P450 [Xylaria arbuscula]